jgi:hypothetical protein
MGSRGNFPAFALLALCAGCDYSGDWLFAGVSEVPGVIDLGEITPATVETPEDLAAAIIYGEVGATGTSARGGVTFSFKGTGGSVCVWVDPELASWNQSVSVLNPEERYTYPDNAADDGDMDLSGGYAVYYTGSPGEEVGDFEIKYEDSLGNEIPIELNECLITGYGALPGGHSGRGMPENCTMSATQPGVNYLVLMETWSTPMDDDRMSYGLLVANERCSLITTAIGMSHEECLITGEALDPATGEPWPGSADFEATFCEAAADDSNDDIVDLGDYGVAEAASRDCSVDHCFCGDPEDGPSGGGF